VLSGRSSLSGHPHHRYGITDLDYNPNKPNTIVTSGKDGLLKFWDLRKKQRPVLVARGGHNHWTSTCAYNPFHDQLVLSAGTDSLVNLWRMSTISSAPLLTLDDAQFDNNDTFATSSIERTTTKDLKEENQTAQPSENPNVRVSRYEHMDAVSAIAWGAADAWIYMSASFDGKVILNHVPSKEKYKILL
jgi:WD40 repeat protein